MNVTSPCGLCHEPIEGKSFRDQSCEQPVCEECARNLQGAVTLLNQHGMVNYYLGPCPDNGPEGLKKP